MSQQDRIELNRYKEKAKELAETLSLMATQYEDLRKDYAWLLKISMCVFARLEDKEIKLPCEAVAELDPEKFKFHIVELPSSGADEEDETKPDELLLRLLTLEEFAKATGDEQNNVTRN